MSRGLRSWSTALVVRHEHRLSRISRFAEWLRRAGLRDAEADAAALWLAWAGGAGLIAFVARRGLRIPTPLAVAAGGGAVWGAAAVADGIRWRQRSVTLRVEMDEEEARHLALELLGSGLHVEVLGSVSGPTLASWALLVCRRRDLRAVNAALDEHATRRIPG